MHIGTQDGRNEHAQQTTGIDGKVKKGKVSLERQGLGFLVELVASKGRDARFDASRPNTYPQETKSQPQDTMQEPVGKGRGSHHGASQYIHNAQVQDGLELAQITVRQNPSKQRRKVRKKIESVDDFRAGILAKPQHARQVDGQDGFHAVKAEPLTKLHPNDEPHAQGKRLCNASGCFRGSGIAESCVLGFWVTPSAEFDIGKALIKFVQGIGGH